MNFLNYLMFVILSDIVLCIVKFADFDKKCRVRLFQIFNYLII